MDVISEFVAGYRREFDYYEHAARMVHAKLESSLNSSGVRAIVTYRAKHPDRLEAKLRQRNADKKYANTADIYQDIVDLAGVRVALYFPGARREVDAIIREGFALVTEPKVFPDSSKLREGKRFSGYWATHYRLRLLEAAVLEPQRRYCDALVEVQVASVLMHAWSEVEHDLVYKPLRGDLSDEEYAILDEINGLVLVGEIALERLQKAIENRVVYAKTPFASHFEVASLLAFLADEMHLEQPIEVAFGRVDILFEFLKEIEVDTPEKLRPFTTDVHGDVEKRDLSAQIIDQILAADEKRYLKFVEVKRRLERESPRIRQRAAGTNGDAALAHYLRSWAALQAAIAIAAEAKGADRRTYINNRRALELVGVNDPETVMRYDRARTLRNDLVHGQSDVNVDEIKLATRFVKELANKLKAG